MEIIAMVLMFIGGIANLVGTIWILINAFKQSIWWGLGSLFLPLVILIYAIMHWPVNKKPFLISIGGLVLMVIGVVMAGGSAAMQVPMGQ